MNVDRLNLFVLFVFGSETEGRNGRRIIRGSHRESDQASQVIQTNVVVLFCHFPPLVSGDKHDHVRRDRAFMFLNCGCNRVQVAR